MKWAVVAILLGCTVRPAELPDQLQTATEQTVRSWRFDRAAWERTVVEPYRGLYDDYARAFDAAVPALVATLSRRGVITTRAHFAGDPRLTRGQAHARWALPVLFPSQVAELDGTAIDLVFVRDGNRWLAITGIDAILRARTSELAPACTGYLDTTTLPACRDVGWMVADAAVRADRARLERACRLAASVCPVLDRTR